VGDWWRLFTDRGTPGWASILLPMLFIGSFNLLAIGISAGTWREFFEEVKARPRF